MVSYFTAFGDFSCRTQILNSRAALTTAAAALFAGLRFLLELFR